METIHLLISGKVQGVFFRQTATRMAERFNVKGWIKNRPDSKVEALITGASDDIKNFINWCKVGPEKANVENVAISKKPEIIFKKFEVLK
jgi:acylphosphatase